MAACWGAKVSVNYRASFENGTFFDVAHWGRSSPLEAQLTPPAASPMESTFLILNTVLAIIFVLELC